MKIRIFTYCGHKIAEIISNEVVITGVQDALDLMADCNYQGATSIIVKKENLINDFFFLKTGIAGDILQKFSNYRNKLAIVGDFSENASNSLNDFMFESNKTGNILFVETVDAAKNKLVV